jgi:hypothetical protein
MAFAAGTVAYGEYCTTRNVHCEHFHFASGQPTDTDDLIKFFLIIHSHWLVIVFLDNLSSILLIQSTCLIKVGAKLSSEQFRVPLKQRRQERVELCHVIRIVLESV